MSAYVRWAELVVRPIGSSSDPATLDAWGRCVGASVSTLRARCLAIRAGAKDSRDLARLLRVIAIAGDRAEGWDPAADLATLDPRTLRLLLLKAGLSHHAIGAAPPSFTTFLARQRFVHHERAVAAVAGALPVDTPAKPRQSQQTVDPNTSGSAIGQG